VTATRDRDSDLDSDLPQVEWDDRPVFGSFRGLPWWAAVLLALVLSAAGAVVDRARLVDDERLNALGVYQVAFLAGCVLAVLAVRRRNLFGPMVQPPLIFAATFVPVQLTARTSTGTDTGAKKLIFEVGLPLASSFPWMAGATAATIVLGVIRLLTQRDPNARPARLEAEGDDRPPRRPREDREERPPARARSRSSEQRSAPADRPPREERRPREDREAPQAKRREQGSPQRRPARDDRAERPERGERRDRGDRGDRGNRSEAPPRRNPQRPRERDQGAKPRGQQQRRRPREDDYLD
jgi:hypothetical protein